MPKYLYIAKTKDSRTIKTVEEALSKKDLINRLKMRGLFIISIEEWEEKGRQSTISLFSSIFHGRQNKRLSVKLYDLTLLARNLAIMLSSGVTLSRSLDIISSQSESARLEKILKQCGDDIKRGLSLGEAVKRSPKVFNSLWQGVIEVGEASGNLPFVLDKLADYLELRSDLERKIKSAMIYPAILLTVAVIAVFLFFKIILPKFSTIFTQFNITLPLPTRVLFSISKFLENNFLSILGVTAASIFLFFIFKNNSKIRSIWDKVSLRLPILGGLILLASLERFTSTIYILLESGLPLVYTLEISARGVDNSLIAQRLFHIKGKVRDGAPLSEELEKEGIFPLLISEMSKIGEETGTMPEVFKKISEHYQKDLSLRIERLVAVFEPVMIVIMGIVIGSIVISLFLPLFKISTLGGM